MGGVWDATNVIVPVMSIITSVGMDHMEYLGDDLEGIAREKSGIIKPGRPVVTGKLNELAGGVVRRKAAELDAPLVQAGDRVSVERKRGDLFGQRIKAESQSGAYGPMELPLAGRYQLENCAVALAALEVLGDCAGFTLKPETVRRGVEGVRWPGRCEVVARDPVVLLDGAHNVDGAKRLARVVRDDAPGPVAMVLGLLEEKDAGGIAGILGPVAERIWLVEVASPRAMSLDTMKAAFIRVEKKVEGACLQEALDAARKWAKERNGMVCVAGSLYLLGEVYKWLGYDPFREATGVSGP
jgi:dihydrofolate synthase/folylpolyglutamate synthase